MYVLTAGYHAHHPLGVDKTGNLSEMGTQKANKERNRVIMLHNLCHKWEFTFTEERLYQKLHHRSYDGKSLVARIKQFYVQQQQCHGVLGTCILGFDTNGVEQLLEHTSRLREKIGVSIGQNWMKFVKDELGDTLLAGRSDSQIGDLIFLFAGFEGHHVDNATKTRGCCVDSMKDLGVVVCMWCHLFHTMVLGHLKNQPGRTKTRSKSSRSTKKDDDEDVNNDDDDDDDDDDDVINDNDDVDANILVVKKVTQKAKNTIYHKIKNGSRVAILWPGDKKYYPCTVENKHAQFSNRWYIRWNNDATEWIDMDQKKLRWCENDEHFEEEEEQEEAMTSASASASVASASGTRRNQRKK